MPRLHRLAGHGARLRFRTQDFDRKYLALVESTGRKVPVLDDENSCQVVFTVNVGKMQAAGWTRARYYTPVAPQEATREP